MVVIDIPLDPPENGTWPVTLPSGDRRAFTVRHDAVNLAAKEAAKLAARDGRKVLLSLEGEDGKWRLFGPDLKAPFP